MVLEGQRDPEADGLAPGQRRALVGGLHHARAAAGAHAVRHLALGGPPHGPLRRHLRQLLHDVEHGDQEGLLLEPGEGPLCPLVVRVRGRLRLRVTHGLLVLRPGLGTGRAEKHDDVVDAVLLQHGPRLLELAHHANHPGALGVQELRALVGLLGLRTERGFRRVAFRRAFLPIRLGDRHGRLCSHCSMLRRTDRRKVVQS
mmetsp:Transcript_100156/g.283495  ORF Transcript_100156/g.283495 Transcript_100156/m.283495 type:complete len:201 (+) Transcript_100156:960-1562(+)